MSVQSLSQPLDAAQPRAKHDCLAHMAHFDCRDCGAVVYCAESYEAVDDAYGLRCPDCSEVVCSNCSATNAPDAIARCRPCADAVIDAAQRCDGLVRAISALRSFIDYVRAESNPIALMEAARDLDDVHGTLAEVERTLPTQIARAYGQQSLPGVAA